MRKKPPFEITNTIIDYVAEISELVTAVLNSRHHDPGLVDESGVFRQMERWISQQCGGSRLRST